LYTALNLYISIRLLTTQDRLRKSPGKPEILPAATPKPVNITDLHA